jgi:hypothetical protein
VRTVGMARARHQLMHGVDQAEPIRHLSQSGQARVVAVQNRYPTFNSGCRRLEVASPAWRESRRATGLTACIDRDMNADYCTTPNRRT